MIRPAHHGIEVWLCVEPVDFRKQSTGLATLVQDRLSMDPFSSQLFAFTNRRRTQCRILYWERCGFVLWHKRLERARFAWPRPSPSFAWRNKYLAIFEHLEPPIGHRHLPSSECAGEGTGETWWSETSVQQGRSGSIKANTEWLHIGGH